MDGKNGDKGNKGIIGPNGSKGINGDKINAILVPAGHNLRLILNHIRKMMKENPMRLLQIIKNFWYQILLKVSEAGFSTIDYILLRFSGTRVRN